jgi:hypothetical protein
MIVKHIKKWSLYHCKVNSILALMQRLGYLSSEMTKGTVKTGFGQIPHKRFKKFSRSIQELK